MFNRKFISTEQIGVISFKTNFNIDCLTNQKAT